MFVGSLVAIVTPMRDDGTVDFEAWARLLDFHAANGTAGVVVGGTTGESATLTEAELRELTARACEQLRGRAAVIAGAGTSSTATTVARIGWLAQLPIDGLLLVTPAYNRPTQEGLYQHFRAVADATPLPIVLYNVPGRTGVNIEISTLLRLAAVPNIVGVKEASGNMPQMCDICRAVPADFLVLCGDDPLTLPLMAVGGRGVISVASNEVPAEMAQMVEAAERNDFAAARAIHDRIMPLMTVNFVEANPLSTPPHIVPEWYFLPYYAILRSIPNKLLGVVAMFSSILILVFVPWLDTSRVRSSKYRPVYKWFFFLLVISTIALGYLGSKPPEGAYVYWARVFTAYYFLHFLVIMPIVGVMETPSPLPRSITESVLGKGGGQPVRMGAPAAPERPWPYAVIPSDFLRVVCRKLCEGS